MTQIARESLFRTKLSSYIISIVTFIIFLWAVNMIPTSTTDMYIYMRNLYLNQTQNLLEAFQTRWEPGFVIYQWILSKFTISETIFVSISASIIWWTIYVSLRKKVSIIDLSLIMFGYLSFFYLYNFSTNTLRQGIAAAFILLFIVCINNKEYKKAIFSFALACSFHVTAIISFFLFIINKFKITLKSMVVFYIFSSLLMLTGLNSILIPDLTQILGGELQSKVESYSSSTVIERYGLVNRLDFYVFTTVWVLWSLFFVKRFKVTDSFYTWIIKSYLLLSSVYLLFGFIGYSDRIAAFGWFLTPILIFYPIIKMNNKDKLFMVFSSVLLNILMFFYFNGFKVFSPLKIFY